MHEARCYWLQTRRCWCWVQSVKPGTHWQQSRLSPYTVDFVAGFGDKSATTWIQQLFAVDIVANSVDFVTTVYGAKATWLTLLTFNKVDHLEFNFADSVYRALVPPCELILLRTPHTKRRRDCLSLSCRQHNSLVDVNTKLSEAFQMYHSLMQGYATAARQPDQVYTCRVVMCLWHTNFLYVRQ